MATTAAADKTTAAFFMGFPFTKIKRQAKAFVPISRYALFIARLVPSRGTQQKNRKPEICSGQIRNSEPISIRAVDFNAGDCEIQIRLRGNFHFLEGWVDMRAVLEHEEPAAPSGGRSPALAATGAVPRFSVVPASHEHTAAAIVSTEPPSLRTGIWQMPGHDLAPRRQLRHVPLRRVSPVIP